MLWEQFINWLWNTVHIRIPLSKIDVIFGIKNSENSLLFNVNYFILQGKQFIHTRKGQNKDLFYLDFISELKQHIIVEKHRYAIKGENNSFEEKWNMFHDILF